MKNKAPYIHTRHLKLVYTRSQLIWIICLISPSLSIEDPILQPLFTKYVSYPGNQQMFLVLLENLLGYSILQTILVVVLKCWFCCLVYAVCCTHVQHIYSLYAIPYRVFHILVCCFACWSDCFFLFVTVCNFVPHCWLCMRELAKSRFLHFQTPLAQLNPLSIQARDAVMIHRSFQVPQRE